MAENEAATTEECATDTVLNVPSVFNTIEVHKSVDPYVDIGNLLLEDLEPLNDVNLG